VHSSSFDVSFSRQLERTAESKMKNTRCRFLTISEYPLAQG
jgi:hypothetical protein